MTDDPREPPVCFRPGTLAGSLDARGDNRNTIAKRDLERYYEVIEEGREDCSFTPDQAGWLVHAAHDAVTPADLIWAIERRPATPALGITLSSISSRSLAQIFAIIDAIERYHALPADTPNKLQAVGLIQ